MSAGNLFVALFVGALVFAAGLLALRARHGRSVVERLRAHIPELEAEQHAARRSLLAPIISVADRLLSGTGVRRRLESALERSGSELSPGQLSLIMLGSGLAGLVLFRLMGLPLAFGLLTIPVGGLIPYLVIWRNGAQRQRAFDEQLPDLLMTMAAAARVGHSFRQSMQAIVTEGIEPAASEFRRVLLETDVGRPLERALTDMGERIGSRNFTYVVNVLIIQREVGGSVAGLLDMVAETVRQRQQFRQKVKALTAMGRLSAYALVALPFLIVAALTAIDPAFMSPLFTTSIGRILMIFALVSMAIGGTVLKKIVSFRID